MLVTTPEKWDVVTRKSTGDVALTQIVKLLIIDEVHLLHDERGSVIECLVARTLRQVNSFLNVCVDYFPPPLFTFYASCLYLALKLVLYWFETGLTLKLYLKNHKITENKPCILK